MSFPRTSRRPPLLAFVGLGFAGIFIVLASSLNPVAPTATVGLPTLPVGLRSTAAAGLPSPTEGKPTATPDSSIALVPVTSFRSAWTSTDAAEVAAVAAGTSARYGALEVLAAGSAATLLAIGVDALQPHPAVVAVDDDTTLKADLAAHPDRLGFLPLPDVDPSVRALGWGDLALFGVHRLATLEGWPLRLELPAGTVPATTQPYDPSTAWTLVAGGDISLDGQV
ncbi:MAG TPA: hypothetical protein VKC59_08525, partial [Candidatus Limnocylindrales bacterium]|nr:hypothetical protein [Candidatus Limnocylindrales bacterium]